jgi:hypothetical protein
LAFAATHAPAGVVIIAGMRWFSFLLCLLPPSARANDIPLEAVPSVILPDGEGVLDLAAAQMAQTFDAIPNPFRVRYRPAPPVREVALVISAVLIPGRPEDASAVINGRLYSPGDRLEGLKLTSIGADSLELRGDDVVVRVPVQDQPPKLRLSH